jgi:hypothetical protein
MAMAWSAWQLHGDGVDGMTIAWHGDGVDGMTIAWHGDGVGDMEW